MFYGLILMINWLGFSADLVVFVTGGDEEEN